MLRDANNLTLDEGELLQWIKGSVESNSNIFSRGYQGHVFLYKGEGSRRLIIKVPTGWWFSRFIRRIMLRNEYRVYSRLPDIEGIPRCFGLLDGSCLVLEFIDGVPVKGADILDRDFFFEALLDLIKQLHDTGVAHSDLKKKDNILVVQGRKPYVVDFGTAVVKKQGFAPLNNWIYDIAKQFDLNAWVKLKYDGRFENVSEEDRKYYNRTAIEKMSRWIKGKYLIVKKAIIGRRKISG
jgi:predicted Ser/Thr protein kinase